MFVVIHFFQQYFMSLDITYAVFSRGVHVDFFERKEQVNDVEISKYDCFVEDSATTVICHVDVWTPHQPLVQLRLRGVT